MEITKTVSILPDCSVKPHLIKMKHYPFFCSSPCFSDYIITDASPSSTHSFPSAKLLNPPPLTCPLPDCVSVCVCTSNPSCSVAQDTQIQVTQATHTHTLTGPQYMLTHSRLIWQVQQQCGQSCWYHSIRFFFLFWVVVVGGRRGKHMKTDRNALFLLHACLHTSGKRPNFCGCEALKWLRLWSLLQHKPETSGHHLNISASLSWWLLMGRFHDASLHGFWSEWLIKILTAFTFF